MAAQPRALCTASTGPELLLLLWAAIPKGSALEQPQHEA